MFTETQLTKKQIYYYIKLIKILIQWEKDLIIECDYQMRLSNLNHKETQNMYERSIMISQKFIRTLNWRMEYFQNKLLEMD